ncbi:MAG: hypothetical protein DRP47_05950 [Candidatus Zixiibacteriota bacterium]|nr:MAG: hypothetical protein DRP47_05950 [candidate division Zixibacteria bacterium]
MAELYLIGFKGNRNGFFYNSYYHDLKETNFVIVEVERGEDLGLVKRKLTSDIDLSEGSTPRSILRSASEEDISHWKSLCQQEKIYKQEVIEMGKRHGLPMKIVDVDCQFDGNKMTVYFTADHRVDFRDLVKELAAHYRTRIELRQIGVRDEARRIGGYGICGRPQCCISFIRNFEPISTQHAREQDLPLNPAKISGNCGRLLCCLRHELDLYIEVKKKFPAQGTRVDTAKGQGIVERIDVFNEEAIIRNDDRLLFRCSREDILQTVRHRQNDTSTVRPYHSHTTQSDTSSKQSIDELDDEIDAGSNTQS